jgi:hypothetical protein
MQVLDSWFGCPPNDFFNAHEIPPQIGKTGTYLIRHESVKVDYALNSIGQRRMAATWRGLV